MGLADRFSGQDDEKNETSGEKKEDTTKSSDTKNDSQSDSTKSSDTTDSQSTSSSGGDGGGKSSLLNNPYASNLKDVLTGKKSKGQAALDAGKHALKKHGGKLLGGGLKAGAKAAAPHVAMGLGYLYIFQRLLNMMQAMLNAFLQSPLVNALLNIVGMVMNGLQAASGFFAGIGHAVAHGIGSVMHGIGSFFGGIAQSLGAGSTGAAAASVGSQVITGSLIPLMAIAFVTGAFNDKNVDDDVCSIQTQQTPHYGKLGAAKYYKNNQAATVNSIYKAMKKGGYTDNTIFALIGNWQVESHFDPKTVNSIGASGLVQWYKTRWNGDTQSMKWYAAKNHGSMTDLGMQLNFADWELHNTHKADLQAIDKAKSLDEATQIVWHSYENPGEGDKSLSLRQKYASEWEKKIKGGSISGAVNDAIASAQEALGCGKSADDTSDWSGSIKEKIGDTGAHWTWKDTPKDIKRYIHDPNDVGMKFEQEGSGWFLGGQAQGNNSTNEQCVVFAESYFLKIHGLSASDWVSGNGEDMVNAFSAKLGGKGSDTPNQGDIAAVKGGSTDNNLEAPVDGTYYGHTFVVSHVLRNGDLIGLEQNMTFNNESLSGTYTDTVGWNTIVLSKATYKKWGIKFYHPDEKKHPLKWSKSK